MSFDSKLLDAILACTKCRSALVRDANRLVCACPECRMKFEIRDEIPNMLLEEASPLAPADWSQIMRHAGRDPDNGMKIVPR